MQFLLFVPSIEHRPLKIRRQGKSLSLLVNYRPLLTSPATTTYADGSDAPLSFISPQRGGVVIYNPPSPAHELPPSVPLDLPLSALRPAFCIFERQLRALLGVPLVPPGGELSTCGRALSAPEVDSLTKRRLREATRDTVETLAATVKLASEIQNMQINAGVQRRVEAALDQLDEVRYSTAFPASPPYLSDQRHGTLQAASTNTVISALSHVATAQSLASRAYFDPSMMGLLYFPDEHKYAVYTPLFGPVAVPLLLSLLKEFKLWRDEKRKRKKARAVRPLPEVGEVPADAREKQE